MIDFSRFNDWTRLQRTIMAYGGIRVVCYINGVRQRNDGLNLQQKVLTQEELAQAEVMLWKTAREEVSAKERWKKQRASQKLDTLLCQNQVQFIKLGLIG